MKDNKDTEKLKNFRMKVDKDTDMFGKPQEIPMAKDATFVKSPISGYQQAESNSDQTTGGRIMEQVGQGLKYVGKKTLEGMANAVEGF